jgi:hypothetical protein
MCQLSRQTGLGVEVLLRLLRVFHYASVELPGLDESALLCFQVETLETSSITPTIGLPALNSLGSFNMKHTV